ncbi:MAG TPA: M4 family metallopeptidase, partial [Geothrix sp.]
TWGDGLNYNGGSTTSANGQTAAVDAHYGVGLTYDFYKNIFGRNGIDGLGTATYSRVHYSSAYDNAFWSDSCFCMTYGDGSSFKSLESIDVAGHEMSHGVMAKTANLTYRGESGGLNEANSDIFGTMVEFMAHGGGTTTVPNYTNITSTINVYWTGATTPTPSTSKAVPAANYYIGEQLATASYNRPLRFMHKPSLDGKSPDAWSKSLGRLDVHYSSGVANHFYFLLSHGSQVDSFSDGIQSPMANGVTSVTGLGNDKAARIWYRALTVYMTSSTNYAGARVATLNAATDLYGAGSVEYNTVNTAWKAVNVL